MAGSPFNPLNWVQSAQDWFRKTERSSGFRPYLIFLIIHVGFSLAILGVYGDHEIVRTFVVISLYISFLGFVILFAIKCFQDPNFCRSEKHIENVRRMELMEKKGDVAPKLVHAKEVEVISNPERKLLPKDNEGEQ